MILPAERGPFSDESWAVMITYEDDGYVKDDDAAALDYAKLLRQMQEDTREENKQRTEQGYDAVDLIGWAAPPHYDVAAHKIYWAKELKFGEEAEHTLNYNIRVLGRRGVLVLNAIGTMNQLPTIEAGMQSVLTFVDFNEGHRYADYVPSADKVAAYGITGLVAGKVAAKVGLFKLLIGFVLAAKKFVVLGAIAALAFFRQLFKKKNPAETGLDA